MNRATLVFILLAGLFACQQESKDLVLVPAGKFTLGVQAGQSNPRFMSERTTGLNAQPLQEVHLDPFYIDRYEVTYADFMRFKPQAKYKVAHQNEPMRGVSWYEADAYCAWIGKRLPTEFEWEKAARGGDDRSFVWGQESHNEWANLGKKVQPVGSFKKDVSQAGVFDMTGNVSEWTASWYRPYPDSTYKDENFGEKLKVSRGGGIQKREHGFMQEFITLTYRNPLPPKGRFWDTGFRCALSVEEKL